MHGYGAIHEGTAHLPLSMSLKQNASPVSRNRQQIFAKGGVLSPLPTHAEIFTVLILSRKPQLVGVAAFRDTL